jgi:glycerol kinase
MGAAYMAGLAIGFWSSQEELAVLWKKDQEFKPGIDILERVNYLEGWQRAIRSTQAF